MSDPDEYEIDRAAPLLVTAGDWVRLEEERDAAKAELERLNEALKTYPTLPEDVFIGFNRAPDKVVWLIRRLMMFERSRNG